MLKRFPLLSIFFALSIFSGYCRAERNPAYPPARTENTEEFIFGQKIKDPYRWLENGMSTETISWIQAENKLTESYLNQLPGRDQLSEKLRGLYYVDSLSLPEKRGHRLFYERRSAQRETPLLCWKEEKGKEHVILNPEDSGSAIKQWIPSKNGKLIAVSEHHNNTDKGVLQIRAVDSAKVYPESIGWEDYCDLAWSSDNRGFYYTRISTASTLSDADRVAKADVAYHKVGSNPEMDISIYPVSADASLYLTPSVSSDGHWLFITANHGWTSSNIYYRDLRKVEDVFIPLFVSTSATASVLAWKDHFYLLTTENASHAKVLVTRPQGSTVHWDPLVPERDDAIIESMKIIGGRLILVTQRQASNRIEIWSLDGQHERDEPLPAQGHVSGISGEENNDHAFFEFQSFAIPPEIHQMRASISASAVWSQRKISFDPSFFKVETASFPSKDGTPVSMFIIRPKTERHDGSAPFLLEGYGGFNVSLLPYFRADYIPLLEAGFGIAVPHLRGGGEYGEEWHRAGMLTKKQNTFDDFLAAAQFLIERQYTRPDRLMLEGNSNGGLLIGAALTQRPDLFRAAVCRVPLLDMIRYPLFGEGPAWVPEYGSPTIKEQFEALAAYSPYHHVKSGAAYPSTLFISAEKDDRVDPMHARKMTAAMQAANVSENPILLLTLTDAGHGGNGKTKSKIDLIVDQISFFLSKTASTLNH